MAIYSIARRSTNVTSGQSSMEIIAAATDKPSILEVGVFLGAATASTYSFGRPAAAGITPTSPVVVLAENPAEPAGLTGTALAWGTSPTSPNADARRISFPANVGVGVIWTFPKGYGIAVSATAVIQNLATNGVVDDYVVVEE